MRVILFMCQLCHQEVELGKKEIRNITRRLEQYNLSKETVAELQEKRKMLQSNVQILKKIRSQLTDAAKSELSRNGALSYYSEPIIKHYTDGKPWSTCCSKSDARQIQRLLQKSVVSLTSIREVFGDEKL